MRLQQRIDIGRARRFELPSALGQSSLLSLQQPLLLAEDRFRAEGLRQIGTALIAFGNPQAEQGFQAKVERDHELIGFKIAVE
jgi:hypothetical protein